MKIEIEIDDETALRLRQSEWEYLPTEPDDTAVKIAAERVLRNYAHRPELVSQKHLAALAIVRSQVAAQAEIGPSHTSHSAEAERLLDFVLSGQ